MITASFIELSALCVYLAVLLAIGIGSARQIRTSLDYTLAGRGVPWMVLLATTAATMVGGGASIGSVGNVYKVGIAAALITCAWHLQLMFTGLFVAPKLRGLNLITVGDYFELKFGLVARDFSVVHCVIFLVGATTAALLSVLSGVLIAALMAAVMSSADSTLSCLSTLAMEDVFRRHFNMEANDALLLRVARWTTLLAGVAAAVCAYFFDNIILALEFIYDFWAPGMVVPFLVGVFWYRENRVYAVVASMTAGTLATVIWRFALDSPWQLSPALFGFVVAVAALFIALSLTRQRPLGRLFQPRDSSYHESVD